MEEEENLNEEPEEVCINDAILEYKLPAAAPKINWGGDFDSMPADDKVAFLKKFANSFNHALDLMQKERNALMDKSNSMEAQVLSLKEQVKNQMLFVQETVKKENEVKRVYQIKINALEKKVRELMKDGVND